MPTIFKYIKALTPINLFQGALWMEEEDIVKVTEAQFNDPAVQTAITNNEVIEVAESDFNYDVVAPNMKLRGTGMPLETNYLSAIG